MIYILSNMYSVLPNIVYVRLIYNDIVSAMVYILSTIDYGVSVENHVTPIIYDAMP